MKTGKFEHVARGNRQMGYKSVAVLLALVLLMGTVVGGTLAWLLDQTDPVTNTFTAGNIDIDLTETEKDYKIIPGGNDDKNPTVVVKKGSEACWLFVQVKEVNNSISGKKYVTFDIADGWHQLGTTENGISVYYREQAALTGDSDSEQSYAVLKDNEVTYSDELTKTEIDELYVKDGDGNVTMGIDTSKQPKIVFKAFAVQKNAAANALIAWGEIAASEKLSASSNP